jgi:hypothetical protein
MVQVTEKIRGNMLMSAGWQKQSHEIRSSHKSEQDFNLLEHIEM